MRWWSGQPQHLMDRSPRRSVLPRQHQRRYRLSMVSRSDVQNQRGRLGHLPISRHHQQLEGRPIPLPLPSCPPRRHGRHEQDIPQPARLVLAIRLLQGLSEHGERPHRPRVDHLAERQNLRAAVPYRLCREKHLELLYPWLAHARESGTGHHPSYLLKVPVPPQGILRRGDGQGKNS